MTSTHTQQYVAAMCESIDAMKLTYSDKEMVEVAMWFAIEYANAKHGMHSLFTSLPPAGKP